jgi:hypothetical protein
MVKINNITMAVPVDSPHNESFGHWVFESAIFLPEIKNSNMKVILSNKKTYKLLFCNYFGFGENDIEYHNLIRQPILTLMDKPPSWYPSKLSSFCARFSSSVVPDVDFVLLPRQTKENYVPNDRPCPLRPFLDVFLKSNRTYRIVNTDEITSLQQQIDLVNSGRIVIVTDGSSVNVNGILCNGKTIYAVRSIKGGGGVESQVKQFPMLGLVHSEIKKKNILHFIDGNDLITLI